MNTPAEIIARIYDLFEVESDAQVITNARNGRQA